MLYLNGKDIMKAITLDQVMDEVARGYRLLDEGNCHVPDRAFYGWQGNKMIYMPCFAPEALMTKILSFFPNNYKLGKPTLDGVVLWKDPESGEILSIMDAKKITALRTAAAGGLGVRYLSAPDAQTLGIVGAGAQGLHLALFACTVRDIRHIYIHDLFNQDAARFAAALEQMLGRPVPCTFCADPADLLRQSEIVITATTSGKPVLPDDAALLADKCFVGVGSYNPSMRELPPALWQVTDKAYVDLLYAMEESGDLSQPIDEGLLKKENVRTISTLLGGPVQAPEAGRSNFFKTVGMALVDLTTAERIYKNALELGIGQKIEA